MIVRTSRIFLIFRKSQKKNHNSESFFQGTLFGEVFSATRGTGPTFLNPLCQLWPKYIAPGRETQRFHMHLLMFLLLQQLQQQKASTQRFGARGPTSLGPPGPLCVEAFCYWSSKTISKYIWNFVVPRTGAIYLGHSWQRAFSKVLNTFDTFSWLIGNPKVSILLDVSLFGWFGG